MNKILAIAIAMFFVLSIISVVVAEQETGTYWGEVKAIDTQAKTFSVQQFQPSIAPVPGDTGGYMFRTDDSTMVVKCNGARGLSDLRAGDIVNVLYREKDEIYTAKDIHVKSCS